MYTSDVYSRGTELERQWCNLAQKHENDGHEIKGDFGDNEKSALHFETARILRICANDLHQLLQRY